MFVCVLPVAVAVGDTGDGWSRCGSIDRDCKHLRRANAETEDGNVQTIYSKQAVIAVIAERLQPELTVGLKICVWIWIGDWMEKIIFFDNKNFLHAEGVTNVTPWFSLVLVVLWNSSSY